MNNISILIIEDDTSLIEQLKEYFEIFFNTVYLAHNAEEGYIQYKKLP